MFYFIRLMLRGQMLFTYAMHKLQRVKLNMYYINLCISLFYFSYFIHINLLCLFFKFHSHIYLHATKIGLAIKFNANSWFDEKNVTRYLMHV